MTGIEEETERHKSRDTVTEKETRDKNKETKGEKEGPRPEYPRAKIERGGGREGRGRSKGGDRDRDRERTCKRVDKYRCSDGDGYQDRCAHRCRIDMPTLLIGASWIQVVQAGVVTAGPAS